MKTTTTELGIPGRKVKMRPLVQEIVRIHKQLIKSMEEGMQFTLEEHK